MSTIGDIKLNGKTYRVNLSSYRMNTVSDFSPKVSTAGGAAFSQLNLFQQLSQEDWRHGFGFIQMEDPSGYMHTEGLVDTRHSGVAMLYTSPSVMKSATVRANGFIRYKTFLFSWGPGGGFYSSDNGSNWSASNPTGTATAISAVWQNGKYLFACVDDARLYYTADCVTWTATGTTANSGDYAWIVSHDGYVFAGKDKDSNGDHGTEVYYGSADDLSDLNGVIAEDPNVLYVGTEGGETVGAVSFASSLIVFRTDGVYQMNTGRDGMIKILPFEDVIESTNFRNATVHNGVLIFAVEDRIYQWNGSRLADITPKKLNDIFPYITYGNFRHFSTVAGYLYCIGRSNESAYKEDLLCFDGVSWVKLAPISVYTTGTNGVTCMNYDPIEPAMWFCAEVSNGSYSWYKIKFQDRSEFPYASFPTTGDNSLITSWIDSSYPLIAKVSPSLMIKAQGLTPTAQYILVYYKEDTDTAWTAWGGTDGTTNLVDTSGITCLNNPTGSPLGHSTLVYSRIQLKFKLVTTSATKSPILEGYSLRTLMRPGTYYGWAFSAMLETGIQSGRGSRDTRNVIQMLNDLRSARDSKQPIEFVDIMGDTYYVYVTSLSKAPLEYSTDDRRDNLTHYASVNLVEVSDYAVNTGSS